MPRATPLPPVERRAAIMAATEPLLELHGRNVSTRQIADAAGIAEGTIFRVFPNKEALIDAVLEDAFDVRTTCEALARIDPLPELEERLVLAVSLLQEHLRRVFALFHSLALTREIPPQRDMQKRHEKENALLNTALAQVIRPDEHRLAYPSQEAATLVRTITFSMSHPILSDGLHSGPREIVDILLYGITGRPDPVDLDLTSEVGVEVMGGTSWTAAAPC